MDDFYRFQRQRLDLLMEGDQPVGGRWSFDEDNREPPPRGAERLDVPAPYRPREDEIDDAVRADLDRWVRDEGLEVAGVDGPRLFPVTRREALAALDRFVTHRLDAFGPHEDAMLRGDWAMAHSLLSVPLNLGLLDPLEVADRAVRAHHDGAASLASVEGFVRQVVGWREYVWHVYWHFGPTYRRRNALAARQSLPEWFDDLDADAVDAACLSDVLGRGARPRVGAPHPAADGAGQLGGPARLRPRRADRVVPDPLRRRLRLGHAGQRRGHEPARRRRRDGDQALRLGWRLRQPDVRLLRRLPLRPETARRARTPAPSRPATGPTSTATPTGWRATTGWPDRCSNGTGWPTSRPSWPRSRSVVRRRPEGGGCRGAGVR